MSRLTRDGTAEPVSRDQILRRERGQGNINFPCSADHVQDWKPYPVDPYCCCMCDHMIRVPMPRTPLSPFLKRSISFVLVVWGERRGEIGGTKDVATTRHMTPNPVAMNDQLPRL